MKTLIILLLGFITYGQDVDSVAMASDDVNDAFFVIKAKEILNDSGDYDGNEILIILIKEKNIVGSFTTYNMGDGADVGDEGQTVVVWHPDTENEFNFDEISSKKIVIKNILTSADPESYFSDHPQTLETIIWEVTYEQVDSGDWTVLECEGDCSQFY